ncbi:CoA-binding protein [Patescibacteria group bacterium]|nr:CoA-binding protein [Patescibacteria group bacterium]MBU1075364.1 CoA-binding protein [Patescibacteria group bacterium]MBU1951892.1 CoA-binding protein [Patescibacteria group bacterium]
MKKTVAIIGASQDRSKYGNKAVRAYISQGWEVFPVNPNEKEIEGLKVVSSILDIRRNIDRVSLYVPSSVGINLIEDIAKKIPKEVFLNPGTESEKLIIKAKKLGISPILACSIVDINEHPELL